MCGILGFAGYVPEGQWTETHDILNALFLEAEGRGRDASGFVAATSAYKNSRSSELVLDKGPIRARQFVEESGPWRGLRHRRCSMVLGHVRWATHGSPEDNRHNHPLVGRHGETYLTHNGILTDHRDDAERLGLDLEGDCDSEAILRVVEAAENPVQGLKLALRELRGTMATVVYDAKTDWLYLARNGDRPLWMMRLRRDKRWFFASTREILLAALQMVLGEKAISRIETLVPLATNHVYALSAGGTLAALAECVPSYRNLSQIL